MSLVSFDDSIFGHPAAVAAGDDGVSLHVRAISYCARYGLSDGRFPKAALSCLTRKRNAMATARRLVECGLWRDDGDSWIATQEVRWRIGSDQEDELERAAGADRQRRMRDGTNVAVYEHDGYKCVYCGVADDLVVDHVVPFKRGGTSDLNNLVAACRGCNSSKRARTPSEWGQQ